MKNITSNLYTVAASGDPSEEELKVPDPADAQSIIAENVRVSMPINAMSGVYISQLNYDFVVEGNCRESVTFTGGVKRWDVPKELPGASHLGN